MMAPAAVSWAATRGALDLSQSPLAWLAHPYTLPILGVAAMGELITDQLPSTPSRKVPVQFTARILSGALAGAALGVPCGCWLTGAGLGVGGAIVGTLGGSALRGRLAALFGSDRPAAVLEDLAAIALALYVCSTL